MLEFGLLQIPDFSESFVTIAWIIGGAVALLLIWEVATFAAYIVGVRESDER